MASLVPFQPLGRVLAGLQDELRAALDEVLASGTFLNGPQLAALEQEVAAWCGVKYAVGVGSGTQALQILLLAHGIGAGDEVVTTAASFYATAKAISLVGATPVFAEISGDDYNLDPDAAAAAVTPRTKAVLVVHLYGRPVDVQGFRHVTRRAGVLLLEDAAHAVGASVNGEAAGSFGDGAAVSFYPTKNLGALGDAGAVLLPDDELARRARSARFLGWDGRERDHFSGEGISGRMDELQAAVTRVRLRHLEGAQHARHRLAARYRAALEPGLALPPAPPGVVDGDHLFVIRSQERDRVVAELAERGVETQVHYRRPLYGGGVGRGGPFPVTERWAHEVLSLPFHASLTDAEQDVVIQALAERGRSYSSNS